MAVHRWWYGASASIRCTASASCARSFNSQYKTWGSGCTSIQLYNHRAAAPGRACRLLDFSDNTPQKTPPAMVGLTRSPTKIAPNVRSTEHTRSSSTGMHPHQPSAAAPTGDTTTTTGERSPHWWPPAAAPRVVPPAKEYTTPMLAPVFFNSLLFFPTLDNYRQISQNHHQGHHTRHH